MAEATSRRACDRCHGQKLSCKRIGEESCERCSKAQIACTWSPSLRYRKQQQQQDKDKKPRKSLQKAEPSQQPPANAGSQETRRSPKRRRTGSDPDLVSPQTVSIVPEPGTSALPAVTTRSADAALSSAPGPGLDIREFEFENFDHLGLFDAATHQLSHPVLPIGVDQYHHHHHHPTQQQHQPQQQQQQQQQQHHHQHHHRPQPTQVPFFQHWDQALLGSRNGFVDLTTARLEGHDPKTTDQPASSAPLVQRNRGSLHESLGNSGRPQRSPSRIRKQISLRPGVLTQDEENGAHPNTPLHWMARLSEINARLQALASLLPPEYDPASEGVNNHCFPVDEMFQHTRHVADLLDSLTAAAEGQGQPARANAATKFDGSDPGSSMFVLSVYVMLLDLYHKVFAHVRSEVFQQASRATFSFWKLPDVTIGSFAVESTPSLQMSLTIQLTEEFLTRLRRSTAALDPSRRSTVVTPNGGPTSLFTNVVDVSFQEIQHAEESLRQELGALRERIEAMLET